MTDESVIRNIERLRVERGMSQERVAAMIGKTRNTYGNLVGGKTRILNENLQPLSKVFDVSVEELVLGYKPQDTREPDKHAEQIRSLTAHYEDLLAKEREKSADLQDKVDTLKGYVKTLQDMVALLQNKKPEND